MLFVSRQMYVEQNKELVETIRNFDSLVIHKDRQIELSESKSKVLEQSIESDKNKYKEEIKKEVKIKNIYKLTSALLLIITLIKI